MGLINLGQSVGASHKDQIVKAGIEPIETDARLDERPR